MSESTTKTLAIVSIIFSTLIVLYIFMCKGYIDFMDFSINGYGIIISVLAILVTILIGWQILYTISINKKLQSIDTIKLSLESAKITLATMNCKDYFSAKQCIHNYITAIEIALQAKDEDGVDFALGQLKSMKDEEFFEIYKGNRRRYISILKKTSEDVSKLISAINKASEVDK